jgi:hypothetical protein
MKTEMKRTVLLAVVLAVPAMSGVAGAAERLGYHEICVDAEGRIQPWYSPDAGVAYDHGLRKIWEFWQGMGKCPNGVPYYLQHQVWKPEHDPRGLGGDQLSMALSSWTLLYAYLGD